MTDVVAITYNGTEFTMRDLTDMPMSDLIEMHNDLAQDQDKNMVTRFETRGIGIKRVWDMLRSIPETRMVEEAPAPVVEAVDPAPVQEQETPEEATAPVQEQPPAKEATSARKKRDMYFNFPLGPAIKPARKGSLRDRVLQKMLAAGMTFDEVVAEVKAFDADRAAKGVDMKGSDKFPERRAYEITRIVHYELGYGLAQSEAGVITAFASKAKES